MVRFRTNVGLLKILSFKNKKYINSTARYCGGKAEHALYRKIILDTGI